MNKLRICIFLAFYILLISCQPGVKRSIKAADITAAFDQGNLTLVTQWTDSLLVHGKSDSITVTKLKSLADMATRIKADFTLSEAEIESRLKNEFGGYSQNDRIIWEKNNWLEYKIIDGAKRYFKRAVSNLKIILESQNRKNNGEQKSADSHLSLFRLEHTRKVLSATGNDGKPVVPVKMKVTYRLTVKADAIPDSKSVRCWLPWPRGIHERQKQITLIKTFPENHLIGPDSMEQRSVYLEQKALKGKPVIFELEFEYLSMAQHFDIRNQKIWPYDTTSVIFKKYTREQYPQIVFTDQIKKLSDSLVTGINNPVEKVRRLYYWINDHIIWTGALEYSIIPFIPGYVLNNLRGDCGMQTLLFMTLARYQQIPVKWQSGWMMHPDEVNLHDWCEVYYQGVGWVPLDMSFHLQNSNNLREKEFYISGIDAYRLIINDAIGSLLVPEKRFSRSEPYDFQRGEVEWDGGNLYFNQWDYHMKVEYF